MKNKIAFLLGALTAILLSSICFCEDSDFWVKDDAVLSIYWPSTTITFSGGKIEYEIDAEGFKSLTKEEANKVSTCVYLMSLNSWLNDELAEAILEKFMPERFKVKKGDE